MLSVISDICPSLIVFTEEDKLTKSNMALEFPGKVARRRVYYIGEHDMWRHDMETLTVLPTPCEGGFPSQRASKMDLWYFHCCDPECAVRYTVGLPVVWDAITPMWRHCNKYTGLNWRLVKNGRLHVKLLVHARFKSVTQCPRRSWSFWPRHLEVLNDSVPCRTWSTRPCSLPLGSELPYRGACSSASWEWLVAPRPFQTCIATWCRCYTACRWSHGRSTNSPGSSPDFLPLGPSVRDSDFPLHWACVVNAPDPRAHGRHPRWSGSRIHQATWCLQSCSVWPPGDSVAAGSHWWRLSPGYTW